MVVMDVFATRNLTALRKSEKRRCIDRMLTAPGQTAVTDICSFRVGTPNCSGIFFARAKWAGRRYNVGKL